MAINFLNDLDVRGTMLVANDTPVATIGSTLEVYRNGSTAELSIHQDDDSASSAFSQLRFRNGGNDTYLKVPTNGQGLIIDTESQANAFVIGTTGNVGIGTTSPTTALQVVGRTKTSELHISNGNAIYTNTGNVGIGTTSPSYLLHVNGNARVSNLYVTDDIIHNGDADTNIQFDTDRVRIVAGGTTKFDSNNTYLTSVDWGDIGGDQASINVSGFNNDANYTANGLATTGGTMTGNLKFNDSVKATFGAGNDLQINHNGTHSYIQNFTGDFNIHTSTGTLYIYNETDDGDVSFQSDDGSGNVTEYFRLDGSEVRTLFSKNIRVNDNVQVQVGSSADLQLYHNGTDSVISNLVGQLYIQNGSDDKDIIFRTDNGSGGLDEYIRLDGSDTVIRLYKDTKLTDNTVLQIGDSADLRLLHDGTDSQINNLVGDLYIQNFADDKDVIFRSDDGSGGVATYFYLDGSGVITRVAKDFRTDDNIKFQLGSAGDASLYHNGTNTVFVNDTGHLIFENRSDDKDIYFKSDDSSGGVSTYFFLDGGSVATQFNERALFIDNVAAEFGSSRDLKIYHDASHSYIVNETGNLKITNGANDSDIIFESDDGSGGVTEYFRLDGSAVNINFAATALFRDNTKAVFGTSSDLQIYHDGSTSFIKDAGTGNLEVWGDGAFVIKSGDGTETKALFDTNGSVDLYYDNSKKFETTSSGASVTGALSTTSGGAFGTDSQTASVYMSVQNQGLFGNFSGYARNLIKSNSSGIVEIGHASSLVSGISLVGGSSAVDGTITFSTKASERMRVHHDGNVGIGTTSPSYKLDVAGNIRVDSTSVAQIFLDSAASNDAVLNFHENASQKGKIGYDTSLGGFAFVAGSGAFSTADMVLLDGGNVGIGTTSPTEELSVSGDANVTGSFAVGISTAHASYNFYNQGTAYFNGNVTVDANLSLGDSDTIYLGAGNDLQIYHDGNNSYVYDSGTGELRLNTGNAVRIRKHDNETMALFTANGAVELYYDNAKKFETTSAGITVTGAITASGDITAFSDERLKEDIKPLEDSLEKVQAIEGVSFVKKNDEDKKQSIGFIAQQLKEVLPEVVHENEDGIHSVAYGNITALLVEAVKEQQEIITQLEERITDLENRL